MLPEKISTSPLPRAQLGRVIVSITRVAVFSGKGETVVLVGNGDGGHREAMKKYETLPPTGIHDVLAGF